MSIASEIDRIKAAIAAAYQAVGNKGGTIPSAENAANLAQAIGSIQTGITPTGTKSITTNGTHDVTNYASANVNVPIPSGYIKPTGTKTINANGTGIDVEQYKYANVSVPIPSGPTVMKHGTYTPTTRITSSNASSYRIDTGVTNPKLVLFALNSYNSNYINKDTSWNQLTDCYWIDDAWRVASDVPYAKGTFLNTNGTVRISTNGMCWKSVPGTSYIEFYTTGSNYCVPTTTFRWVAMA